MNANISANLTMSSKIVVSETIVALPGLAKSFSLVSKSRQQ
jgi:hypothetical protein